jgi:hypothetical protein
MEFTLRNKNVSEFKKYIQLLGLCTQYITKRIIIKYCINGIIWFVSIVFNIFQLRKE